MDLSQACKACIQKQAIRPNKKRRKGGLCNTCYAEQNPHVQQADQNEQRACWKEQKRELRERQMIQSIINNATDESFQKKNVKVFLGDVEKKEGKYIYGVFSGEQEKGAFVEVIMLTPVHEMKIKRGKHETKIVGIVASKDGDEKKKQSSLKKTESSVTNQCGLELVMLPAWRLDLQVVLTLGSRGN
jgi:hypothetical protein